MIPSVPCAVDTNWAQQAPTTLSVPQVPVCFVDGIQHYAQLAVPLHGAALYPTQSFTKEAEKQAVTNAAAAIDAAKRSVTAAASEAVEKGAAAALAAAAGVISLATKGAAGAVAAAVGAVASAEKEQAIASVRTSARMKASAAVIADACTAAAACHTAAILREEQVPAVRASAIMKGLGAVTADALLPRSAAAACRTAAILTEEQMPQVKPPLTLLPPLPTQPPLSPPLPQPIPPQSARAKRERAPLRSRLSASSRSQPASPPQAQEKQLAPGRKTAKSGGQRQSTKGATSKHGRKSGLRKDCTGQDICLHSKQRPRSKERDIGICKHERRGGPKRDIADILAAALAHKASKEST